MGSTCWESCIYHQETNNFCRDPTDDGVPYCRTGGTEAAPTFSDCTQLNKCDEAALGCSYSTEDGSDYEGDVGFTRSGKECDYWNKYPAWEKQAEEKYWSNYCRNPDSSPQVQLAARVRLC